MKPVKVNIFISYAPEDRKQLDVLLRWLYPMRDEVDLRYKDAPKKPTQLSLPWQILLFWYSPPDLRPQYQRILEAQRAKAHIYLFLTSYKSLSNKEVDSDIEVAVQRRVEGDDVLGPFIYPIILAPCRWKEESRIAGFAPMAAGAALSSFKQVEEGYLMVTDEVAALIKVLQSRLDELKFYKSRLVEGESGQTAAKRASPYLGDADDSLEFHDIAPFQPPEWLGWSILLFLFISLINYLTPSQVLGAGRYDNIRPANEYGWEYLREHPMVPPKDSLKFPPPD